MTYERVKKYSSWSPTSSQKNSNSLYGKRPFAIQAKPHSQKPPTQQEIEKEEFQQHKYEAFGLEIQAKHGTITPEGQERLTVLQAKMDAFWQKRRERTQHHPNLWERFLNNGGTPPTEPPTPIQTKLTIGEAGDKYEQEADRVAAKVVNQINAPTPQPSSQGETLQQEEMHSKEEKAQLKTQPMVQRTEEPPESAEKSAPKSSVGYVELSHIKLGNIPGIVEDSSANLVAKLKPLLDRYLTSVHYNSLEDAASFAEHLEATRQKVPDANPQDAYKDFVPNSIAPLAVKGAQCMGQGINLADLIQSELNLPAYPVAAKFAGKQAHGHGAVMVRFQNPEVTEDAGYILMDPGFNLTEPLVITAKESAKARNFIYSLNTETDSIENRESDSDTLKVTFENTKLENPDESVSRSALLSYKAFRVVARGDNIPVVLELNLDEEVLSVRFKKKKATASISDVEGIKNIISAAVAEALGYGPGEEGRARLWQSLDKVIKNKDDIIKLQNSTISMREPK